MKGCFARGCAVRLAARTALGLLAVTMLVAVPWPHVGSTGALAATSPEPMAEIKVVVDQAVAILRDRQMGLPERRRKLRDLAENHFEFPQMARSAIGYHWNDLSDSQREEYTRLFSAFIEAAYLDKIQGYVDLEFQFVGQTITGSHYAEVTANVLQPDSEPINIKFELQREPGGWKIYDVLIDGISMVENYRNQFDRVIKRNGFNVLMSEMRLKEKELSELLGKPEHASR